MKRRSRDRREPSIRWLAKRGLKGGHHAREELGGRRRSMGKLTEVRSRNELAARMSDMSDADSGSWICAVSQCHELLTCTTQNST